MNTKGFTLVELVGIILILSLIFLVSFPVIKNMTKQENDNKYNNMVNTLCSAGRTYMYSNMDSFKELSVVNSVIELDVSELILYGSIEKKLVNPKTNLSVEGGTLKYTVLEDQTLECEFIE